MSQTRRMRRTVALAVAGTLIAAACGGDSAETETIASACPVDALEAAEGRVEVVVWHTQAAQPLTTMEELVEEYNGSQDAVRVKLESQGASYAEIQRKFNQAVASRQLPALIMVDDTFTRSMADSGVVLPAQGCFEADGTDMTAFADVARSYYTIDDVLWPASAGLGNVLLYYNRNHFRRAGLDPEDPPATLEEVRAAAEAISGAGVAEAPLAHEMGSWKTEFWLTGAGSTVVDNDNGRGDGQTTAATLTDNPEALELFEWFDEMRSDGLMQPVPATAGQVDQYIAMATQSASMLVDTSSAATSIEAFLAGDLDAGDLPGENDAPDVDLSQLDLAVGSFPGLAEGGRTQMGGAAWYLLDTVPEEVQAGAWDFMRFMNGEEAQARMLVGGSYIPWLTAANDHPTAAEYYAGEGGLAGAWLRVAKENIDAIDPAFPGPLIGPYDEFREAMHKAQDDLMFGGASPQEALDQAQQEIDRALERYDEENF
jgi:sn-glycerol 3-phosphate transport system substrate-binding protein